MFRIDALPAQQGDALWIEYGSKTAPHRILVDGGTPPTEAFLRARIEALDPEDRTFELLIVTHIDTDHIGGILRLLDDPPEGLSFKDVWFNGWQQLEPLTDEPILGAEEGVSAKRSSGRSMARSSTSCSICRSTRSRRATTRRSAGWPP